MSTERTLTIDLGEKTVTADAGEIALYEAVTVKLTNTGSAAAADVRLAVMDRMEELVTCETFTDETSHFEGLMTITGTEMVARFAGDRDGQSLKVFDLIVLDVGRNKVLVNDKLSIMNNHYTGEAPTPTVIS